MGNQVHEKSNNLLYLPWESKSREYGKLESRSPEMLSGSPAAKLLCNLLHLVQNAEAISAPAACAVKEQTCGKIPECFLRAAEISSLSW